MWVQLYGLTQAPPALSVHENMVRIDMGTLIIETDKKGFVTWIAEIITQAAKKGLNLST